MQAVFNVSFPNPVSLAFITPQDTTALIVFLLVLIAVSFILSGAEVAYFSLTSKDIDLLKTKQQQPFKRVITLLEQPKELLGSLIIGNIISNIGIIILMNILLDGIIKVKEFDWLEFIIKLIVVTFILLLFCEVLPKIFARQNNIRYAKDFGIIVEGVFYLFKRPAGWLMKYSAAIEKRYATASGSSIRDQEINEAFDAANDDGTENTTKEKDILKGLYRFSNISVKQIMRTRLDVNGVERSTSFSDLIKRIDELHYSRLPVYNEDMDEVAGIIHTKDLIPYLDQPANFDWHFLLRTPYFVHENKLIEDLLKEFQSKRIHFAVVVDEFGGTSGIVTMEDIMEEVIGEIKDEFDDDESSYKKIDENNYVFDGRTSISDVCTFMQLPVETFDAVKGDSESLAGLVLEIAGEIPKLNSVISAGDFDFTVLEIEKHRLLKIKVTIRPQG